MATSTESKPQSADDTLAARDPKLLIRIYEMMVLTRAVEDRMVAMYKSGDLLGSLYTGHWHEAISVGSAAALSDGDYMAPIHRDLGAHLCRGMEPWQVMASFMGKATSPTGGRDGTLHYGRLDLGIYILPIHIPANFPVATGMAFAAKYRGEDRVCLAFCGDGSTSRGDFHEALNMAGALTLPCIFVVENNQFAYSTPVNMQTASQDFAGKAAAYGFPGVKVDGTDAVAVYDAVEEAVTRARKGDGPTLIEAVTMRMHGHAEHDPADYVPREMFEEWRKKDPVELFERRLLDSGVLSDATEKEADPDVFLIGEDVGQFGGAFKVTKGFLEKFGPRRVVDTPIAETGFTGLAAGAALVGLRPIVEFQFADFISCAFDPIINVLARHYYRNGDPMPVTMRAPFGGRLRAGPCHSQSVESYFAHVPGIKIVMPGTPQDAAGLLISSIRDNNPTLYLENKYLYRRLKAAGPLSMEPIPLGVANVVREGTDVTLITYSAGVHQGLEIADELEKEGISLEVVDVRTLVPLDVETIVNSVKKTSRAVVLHEAATRMGYGAEIAATIQEEAFWYLDQPILRIGAKNTPTPTSPPLEDAVIPQPADIAAAIRKVAKA